MYSNHEGCVVVLDDTKAIGILTERDIISFLDKDVNMDKPIIDIARKSLISIHLQRSLEYALHILIDNNIRRLIVVDNNENFKGVITQEMIVNNLETEHYRVNLKVSQVLTTTAKSIVTLSSNKLLQDAIATMYSNNIGSILISENSKVIGIITERDIVKFMSKKIDVETPVTDVMTTPIISVNINDSIEHIVEIMKVKGIRRVIVNDEEGITIGVIGTRDIIRNIKGNYGVFVENKLKHTKEALNAINEVIFELYLENSDILIQWGNKLATSRYGTSMIDKSITTLIPASIWEKIQALLYRDGEVIDFKISINQQQYLLSCNKFNSTDATKAFFIICKDVTDYEVRLLTLNRELDQRVQEEVAKNKSQEEQFFAQSRLAQMGEMISMIAHQWRQPLGAVSSIAINLKLKLELEKFDLQSKEGIEEAQEYFIQRLTKVESYVQNLTSTIDDFRNFYKPNKDSVEKHLQEVILKAINIIGASLENEGVELVQEYYSNKKVQVYDGELMQVILNILKNAQDNFKERKITNPKISITTDANTISIQDNGGGIDKDILPKIFDPYFSTKNEKNGTGLGLHMSKIIVQEHHNGELLAQNRDNGVCFTIKIGEDKA